LNSATHTSTRNICSHITTDLIIHWWTIVTAALFRP
jgi:hypothetical protein